ncbi:MAG TPA: YCF48-related protein [Gemmatimonadales bacterium]|nr:YCF48-related protein [Gemmatimonadales bacterium]
MIPHRRGTVAPALLAAALALLPHPAAAQRWTPQASGTSASLRGLHVVSPTVVWASGSRGTVLHTEDGGRTWQVTPVAGADSLDFRSVHAVDARTAVVASAGQPARLYRTTDGGRSWTKVYESPDTAAFFDGLRFWDARRGMVYSDPVNGSFLVLTTADGGRTWTPVPRAALPAPLPREASFAASGSGIVLEPGGRVWIATGGGDRARVLRSSDGGRTWQAAETPVVAGRPGAGIFSLAFRDALHGVAVGGDYQRPKDDSANVAVTADGGRTWTPAAGRRPAGYRSAVAVVPGTRAGTLVAVGPTGTDVSVDGGDAWLTADTVGFNAVGFASPTAGWAVGERGRVARWAGVMPDGQAVRRSRAVDGGR